MRVPVLSLLAAGAVLATVPAATTFANAGVSAPTTAAVAPGTWSTDARVVTRTPAPSPEVTGIRVGHHRGFDRTWVDLDGAAPGFAVKLREGGCARTGPARSWTSVARASLRIVLVAGQRPRRPDTGQGTMTTPKRSGLAPRPAARDRRHRRLRGSRHRRGRAGAQGTVPGADADQPDPHRGRRPTLSRLSPALTEPGVPPGTRCRAGQREGHLHRTLDRVEGASAPARRARRRPSPSHSTGSGPVAAPPPISRQGAKTLEWASSTRQCRDW